MALKQSHAKTLKPTLLKNKTISNEYFNNAQAGKFVSFWCLYVAMILNC